MVQVDVFWAYGIGAGFALAAAHQLQARAASPPTAAGPGAPGTASGRGGPGDPASGGRPGLLDNPYLTGAVLFCAAIFAPSGAWLLWAFPNWETMQVGDHTMPAWLVAAFAATNTTQGLAGFLVTQRLIVGGRIRWAGLQLMAGYFGMFLILVHGWDGTGYQRFLSTDKADFARWASAPPLDQAAEWATSPVAVTLYGMGAVMIPLMLGVMGRWHRDGLRAAARTPRGAAAAGLLFGAIGVSLAAAVAASVLIHLLGPVLGVPAAAALLWALVVRPGGFAGRIVRRLGLPYERPAAAATPVAG